MPTTCSTPDCARPILARGLCGTHYARLRRAGLPPLDRNPARCSEADCGRDAHALGLCRRHYHADRRKRSKDAPPESLYPRAERIGWDVKPNGCWEWRGARNLQGYGKVESILVHRIVFAYHNGGLDPNLVVRHTCDNPSCVNPDHLLVGSQADNMRDMLDRGRQYQQKKTHCPAGHPLVEGNLVASQAMKGHRMCLTCHRERARTQSDLIHDARKALGLKYVEYVAQFGQSVETAEAVLASRASW